MKVLLGIGVGLALTGGIGALVAIGFILKGCETVVRGCEEALDF